MIGILGGMGTHAGIDFCNKLAQLNKGKTYQHVRVNHPEYFIYLSAQSVGSVYRYLDFIKYCIEHLKSNH